MYYAVILCDCTFPCRWYCWMMSTRVLSCRYYFAVIRVSPTTLIGRYWRTSAIGLVCWR